MNEDIVSINIKEDKSVQRLLKKTTRQIRRSIKESNITINEKRLQDRQSPLCKTIRTIADVFSVVLIILCAIMCTCGINSRIQGIPPSFAGYSTMIIASESMEASGFYKGDNIIVKSVDTDTLKSGDIIAFYAYPKTFERVNTNSLSLVENLDEEINESVFSLETVFGIQPAIIREASSSGNSKFVFHHIVDVYEDKSGTRWFTTKGSSNLENDCWIIREDLILGKYDDSEFAKSLSSILHFLSKPIGLLIFILLPIFILVLSLFKDIYLASVIIKLELDVLRGKRLLTDPLCIKYGIGYEMSKGNKLKVLASAPENLKTTYISLLWKDGTAPSEIRKHYLKKSLLLSIYAKRNELDRVAELMIRDGVDENAVALYYTQEKDKLLDREARYKKLLKKVRLSKAK